jgi:hypothetical protein
MKLPKFLKSSLTYLTFSLATFWSVSANAQQPVIIDLSTGTGLNDVMVATGTSDDMWKVLLPGGSTVVPKACTLGAWEETGINHWVSPSIYNGVAYSPTTGGTYTYSAKFKFTVPRLDCATLVIRGIGGDNTITEMKINGVTCPVVTFPGINHFDLTNENITVILNTAILNNNGVDNTLSIKLLNDLGNPATNYTGLNFCGKLHLNDGNFNILPVVTGPTTICQGNPLTFGGSLASGSTASTHYYWRLYECDAAGNIPTGGFYWESSWFTGVPTNNYTFPSNLNIICGKYYMAVLSAVYASDCSNWAQDIHVFNYACKPTANAGPDQTICQSECATIGTTVLTKGVSYNWTANGVSVGTGGSLSVCPETTTTYTVTATNNLTGCSATDQVTITVLPNNPRFNIATNTANSGYYTVTATPVVMNANTVPGFGQYWALEELDATNNYVFYIQSPLGWQPYIQYFTFPGFDDVSTNYSNIVSTLPSSPVEGRFLYGTTYRITRGTWNDNCDWNAASYLLELEKNGNVVIVETKAPASRPMVNRATTDVWQVSPNPSKGIFHISCESDYMDRTVVEVFDISGKKIERRVIETGTRTLPLDLTGYTKGVYLLNITTGDMSNTYKIILE